ncbi:MAG: hypothetical protein H6Q70_3335 [Firmicutes bacterium]|nr:hypothetical protein [Bacillota bacterium]
MSRKFFKCPLDLYGRFHLAVIVLQQLRKPVAVCVKEYSMIRLLQGFMDKNSGD